MGMGMGMGLGGGSFNLLKQGSCGSSSSILASCISNYHRLPLLPALLQSATISTTSSSSTEKKKKEKKKKFIAPLSFSISPPNYGGIVIRNTTSRTFLGWECFCTDSDSSAPADNEEAQEEVDEDENMTKLKQTANTLDIRVGKILKAWRHPEADSLYVEEVDVSEPEPRIICSGLVKYVTLDHLQDMNVVVLANLKPRNMRGVKSSGMLMAASNASHENVELLVPPEGSLPGERIWFGSVDEKENLPDAASPNQIQKKKIWELVQPHLKTDDSCTAALGMHTMRTTGGVVVCRSLKNARIS